MPSYRFEAIDERGALVAGRLDAGSRDEAVEGLLRGGKTPLLVQEGPGGRSPRLPVLRSRRDKDATAVLRDLARLLAAGILPLRAFEIIRGIAKPNLHPHLDTIISGLRGGRSLSVAIESVPGLFSPEISGLVAAAESTGRLSEVMATLAASAGERRALRERLIATLIYPLFLVVTMVGVLTLIFQVVLPRLSSLFDEAHAKLPWSTRIVAGLAEGVREYGDAMVLVLIAAAIAFLFALKNPNAKRRLDRWAYETRLLFGVPRQIAATQLCRSLGLLISSGMTLDRAVQLSSPAIANSYLALKMHDVLEKVRAGVPLSAAFADLKLPGPVVELTAVGEETGRLDVLLLEAGAALDDEVRNRLATITAFILPAVTLVLGLLVALIMAGVVSGLLAVNELAQ